MDDDVDHVLGDDVDGVDDVVDVHNELGHDVDVVVDDVVAVHHVLGPPAPPLEAFEPPGWQNDDMSNIQYTYIFNDHDNEDKKITSRVIGALGPRPRGGAPGAPGAATPPPEKKIFLFSSVSVSGLDIDMEGED